MSTVTARIPEETAQRLEALAKATNRSKSFLIASALETFLDEQGWQIARTLESISQADVGEFVTEGAVKEEFRQWGLDVDQAD